MDSPGLSKRPRVSEENRKRAVRACDGCRRVKEKCEGGIPCRRCARYRRQCIFTHPEQQPRSTYCHPAGHMRMNEANSYSEEDRVHYMERILHYHLPHLSLDVASLRTTADQLQSQQHRGSLGSVDAEDLEDLTIDDEEEFVIKPMPDDTTQYSGEFSYLNFSMKIRRKIDEWIKAAAPEASTETETFEDHWRATQLQSGSSLVSASITCLPPRYVADFLVQIFFKYAQTNNFYIEEDWLLDKLNTCYVDPSSLSPDDAGSVCAILMVLAVGTQFAHMESPTPTDQLSDDHRFSEDEVGLTFYQFASKLLPDIIATTSVRSVQACLLIGTYLLPLDTSGLCYTYFGLALKMAIQNGMHRRYQGEGLSRRTVEVRNRVFWTAYTIEKRVSILHGRPVSLSDTDVDAALPTDFPGLMPSPQVSNHTNMVTLITLTLKLGQVAHEISSLRKSPKGQQQDCLERLLSLRRNLVEWWSTLPEVTNCRDLNPSGPLFRSNVHLKLDYCLTRIFIGRPFLFSNIRGINPGAVSTPTPPFKLTAGASKNRTILVTDCVDAALEIVDLCRLLRDESGLARASFTEFSSCRAALLVILAQSLTKRTERLRESIDKGMALIKIMSMGVGSARSAVSVIEALERAIRRLEEWSVARGGNGSNPGFVESAYDRFKNWEMLWKSGPLTPSVSVPDPNGQDHVASGSGVSTGIPLPLTPLNTAGTAATSTTNIANPDAIFTTPANQTTTHTHGSEYGTLPGQSAFSPENPHFAFDHFVSNFPQELDEFTAIPCFEVDVQQQVQAQNQASGQAKALSPGQDQVQGQGQRLGLSEAADNRWMDFINGD